MNVGLGNFNVGRTMKCRSEPYVRPYILDHYFQIFFWAFGICLSIIFSDKYLHRKKQNEIYQK